MSNVALIRYEDLVEKNKSLIEYGQEAKLFPAKKVVFDKYGKKRTELIDFVVDCSKDHAITREKIVEKIGEKFLNPRVKTEADWQKKQVDEFVEVDGIKV